MGQKTAKDFCEETNCSHFVNPKNVVFYRYKYIGFALVSMLLAIIWFVLSYFYYKDSMDRIVSSHQSFCTDMQQSIQSISKNDSVQVFVDKSILTVMDEKSRSMQSMLEMQYNRIQSEFVMLSLWAGVLMIVFLVFSIYSMFKVDEMQKEARSSLERLENFRDKAKEVSERLKADSQSKLDELDSKSKDELEKIQKGSDDVMEDLRKKVEGFQSVIQTKIADFETSIQGYKTELQKTNETNASLIQGLINMIVNNDSSSKDGKDNPDK